MYKVIFADDEPAVLEGLKLLVDWEKFGFEIAGTADNGESAYELIMRERPRLALLDISMPGMSGIEITKKLSESDIHCEVIILTAYGNTEYAMSCLKYGVKYYLMKPFDIEQINAALEHYKDLFKEQDVRSMLIDRGRINKKESAECIGIPGILSVRTDSMPYLNNVKIYDHVPGIVSYMIYDKPEDLENEKYGVCAKKVFDDVLKNDPKAFGCISYCEDKDGIDECHKKSISSLKRKLHAESGEIYEADNAVLVDMDMTQFSEYAEKIKDCLEYTDENSAIELINEFFETLTKCHKSTFCARMLYSYTVIYINRMLLKYQNVVDAHDESIVLPCLNDCYEAIVSVIHSAIGKMMMQDDMPNQRIVDVVEAYLKEHYKEQIVIKDIAKQMFTTPGYLGSLFTKEMNVSIKEYVNGLRLEEAVRLMTETDKKMSEIAFEVGYNTYNHFYMQFEKRFGMPPVEYQKKMASEDKTEV